MLSGMGRQEDQSGSRGFWGRVYTPVGVLAAAVGILVGLVALASGAVAIFGNPFAADPLSLEAQKDPAAVAAYAVNLCMRDLS